MNVIDITLTDGTNFRVKQLGLFELDSLTPDPLGPFTYKVEILGKEYDTIFDVSAYEEPPKKPEKSVSEIKPNTREHDQLLDWQLYEAAKLHNKRRIEKTMLFYEKVKDYIIKNACMDDPRNIITVEDWRRVYKAALVPQLTMEIIAKTLQNTYAAKFNDEDIFEALKDSKKGRGSYDVIKLWENQLMIKMNKSETEYTMIPLEERARKVCALFLNDIMSHLEMDFESKLRDAKGKN